MLFMKLTLGTLINITLGISQIFLHFDLLYFDKKFVPTLLNESLTLSKIYKVYDFNEIT